MLTAAAIALTLLVALLAIPITLSFRLTWQHSWQGQFTLQWLFGLVTVRPHLSGHDDTRPARSGRTGRTRLKKTRPRRRLHFPTLIKQRMLRRRIARFARDFWRAIHKQDLRLHGRLGLDDPADTGRLWALLGPLSGTLANCRTAAITLEPDFHDATLELQGSGRIRLIPLQLLYLTVGLLLSPSLWQGMRQARRGP